MLTLNRHLSFTFLLFFLLPFTLFAQSGVDITQVAEKGTPSVVSIQVKTAAYPSQLEGNDQYPFQDPFNFFNDPFFHHFFRKGSPKVPQRQQHHQGQASGFIVSEDGYILTNAHVVKNAGEITVVLNNDQEFRAKVIGTDPDTDIAVIKIDATNLPALPLSNSDDLKVGQWVVAIGNPLGLQASVTAGVVSAKGRNNLSLARIEDFIQTDAAINRGNSGGPLLNLDGEVVGMNTAIVTNMGSGGYMGIGFAIPSNFIQYVMDQLIEKGTITRGFMGVMLQPVTQDLAQAFGLKTHEGALIAEITPESPAEKAGIEQGDIILSYNEKKIDNIATLKNAIAMMSPGTVVKLTLFRNQETKTVSLTVGTYPTEQPFADSREISPLGVEVKTLTPETAQQLGIDHENGVVVTHVNPESIAAWAGLQEGAVILSVNQKRINGKEGFDAELQKADPSRPLLLLVKYRGRTHYLSIKAG